MPLATGDRLGPYEILGLIGQGGMGEVYRAHDKSLARDVAIKVLPAALAQDPERLARFEREAKVLAAMNHPNIAIIYGLVERAIVMELVEGPTLQDRLAQGALPQDEALSIARQIADALETAHEKGIVHRDLKPANIKVREDGTVKVLDFGLATAVQSGARDTSGGANSPTLTMGATEAGMILGTAAYMAPEQAAGKPVDRRADIWSFGVVLWEMLTGKRLFQADDVTNTLADVLRKDIDFSQIPAGPVRDLLKRCLDRDVKNRLQWIGEGRIILALALGKVGQVPDLPDPEQIGKRHSWAPWTVAALLLLALATLAVIHFREPVPAPPEALRFAIDPPQGSKLTNYRSASPQFAISPDGRYLTFVADDTSIPGSSNRVLFVRALGSIAAQKLDKTEGVDYPFWSPDSRNIAFFADGKLKRIPIAGGAPINICDAADGEGGVWFEQTGDNASSNGQILFAPTSTSAIHRVSASGGVPTPDTQLAEGVLGHSFPQLLPGGQRFLYFVRGGAKPGIYVQSLSSQPASPPAFLTDAPGRAVVAPPDYLLYLRDNTLLAQHWDFEALKPRGEAVSVADEVRSGLANGRNAFTVSPNGVLVYRSGVNNLVQYRWYTRDGKPDGPPLPPANYSEVALSPDNKRAVMIRTSGSNTDLWLLEVSTGVLSRLTSGPERATDPVWSPDSRRIAFVKGTSTGKTGLYQMVIGSGKDSLVYPEIPNLEAWTRDGLLVRNGRTVSLLPAPEENASGPTTEKPRKLIDMPYGPDEMRVSPDGKWIAYMSMEGGIQEVWVAAFPSFDGRRKVSQGPGEAPLWRADGKELFFAVSFAGGLMAAEVKPGPFLEIAPPKLLFAPATSAYGSTNQHFYAISNDGQRLLIRENPGTSNGEIEPLYLILNWPSLLGK